MKARKLIKIYTELNYPHAEPGIAEIREKISLFLMQLIGKKLGYKKPMSLTPERLARRFHEIYEALADNFGYKTRLESRCDWKDVPEKQKELMRATAKEIMTIELGI